MNIEHVLVGICQEEEKVGGILASALIHRAQAAFVRDKLPPPAADDIKMAIFDLMASEAIVRTPQGRLMPKALALKPLAPKSELRNKSGLWPIGPGDYLYNQAGERVARIAAMNTHIKDGLKEFDITLELLFTEVVRYEFLGPGEVVTESKNPGPLAPKGIPDKDRYPGRKKWPGVNAEEELGYNVVGWNSGGPAKKTIE